MAFLKYKVLDFLAKINIFSLDYDVLILNYHSIVPDGCANSPWEVELSEFKSQIKFIHESGFSAIKFGEISERYDQRATAKSSLPDICITFDDGFEDNYILGLPVLEYYSLTATFAVLGCLISENDLTSVSSDFREIIKSGKKFMDYNMLDDLRKRGFEIVSHTMTHPNFKSIKNINLTTEIVDSSIAIEKTFGSGKGIFILAYGIEEFPKIKIRLKRFLDRADFRVAALGRYGYVRFDKNLNLLDLPRIPIYASDSIQVFKNKLKGNYQLISYVYWFVKKIKAFKV